MPENPSPIKKEVDPRREVSGAFPILHQTYSNSYWFYSISRFTIESSEHFFITITLYSHYTVFNWCMHAIWKWFLFIILDISKVDYKKADNKTSRNWTTRRGRIPDAQSYWRILVISHKLWCRLSTFLFLLSPHSKGKLKALCK